MSVALVDTSAVFEFLRKSLPEIVKRVLRNERYSESPEYWLYLYVSSEFVRCSREWARSSAKTDTARKAQLNKKMLEEFLCEVVTDRIDWNSVCRLAVSEFSSGKVEYKNNIDLDYATDEKVIEVVSSVSRKYVSLLGKRDKSVLAKELEKVFSDVLSSGARRCGLERTEHLVSEISGIVDWKRVSERLL